MFVWSVLLNGCEAWTISREKRRRRLDMMEIWFYRRMLKVQWTARMIRKEVKQRAEAFGEPMNLIWKG